MPTEDRPRREAVADCCVSKRPTPTPIPDDQIPYTDDPRLIASLRYLDALSERVLASHARKQAERAGRAAPGSSAAIYCRTATTTPGEPSALDAQEACCRAVAANRGLVVTGVFRDKDKGAISLKRPGLTALRSAVARGEVAAVITCNHDRLTRDFGTRTTLMREWDRAGIALIFAEQEAE